MENATRINPKNVGVYITSDKYEADPKKKIKGKKVSKEKYGFEDEIEILYYIKENASPTDTFLVYTYELQFGCQVLKPIQAGLRKELN